MITQQPKDYIQSKAIFPAIVSPKRDGVRGRTIDELMYSRRRKRILGMSHIEKQLKPLNIPFDGELMGEGNDFDSSAGLVRNHREEPGTVYHIFDLPKSKSKKGTRLIELLQLFVEHDLESDTVKLTEHYYVRSHEELMDFYQWFLDRRFEGLVYYNIESKYERVKNHQWMRLVPLMSADCRVVGFMRGDGKNLGSLGAILVDYNGKRCKVGTGFKEIFEGNEKEHVRQYIWDNRELFRNAIAECVFKQETKAGMMRQPRFKGWRWDK